MPFLQHKICNAKLLDYGTHHPQVYLCVLKPTHYVLWNDQALPIMLGNVLVVVTM